MDEYVLPPRLHNQNGEIRRVGVEIEFAGLDVAQAAELVKTTYGGTIVQPDRFSAEVKDTPFGDFRVELDAHFLKNNKPQGELLAAAVEGVMKTFVPAEIATPPIPIDRLGELEPLRRALHEANAEGTRSKLRYAFGLHFNPESPDLEAKTLHRYLTSFVLLYDWIVDISDIDLARKIAPFIAPFPEEYRLKVIDPAYNPDRDRLIDDYLELNPTRNRPLDMLPLFAVLDEEKVRAASKEPEQIKKRPTFHYRLPNCDIDDPSWSFAKEWAAWVEVERLASDEKRLEAIRRARFESGAA